MRHRGLGGADLEMVTIARLLEAREEIVHDGQLAWGARASAYRSEIQRCLAAGRQAVLIELYDDLGLDRAIESLSLYDWLIFTSVNGVGFFFDRLFENGLDVRALHHLKTACIGPATAEKLLEYGFNSDIVPESYQAESVVAAFEDKDIRENRILLPRAAEARPILPLELTKMGAVVDEVAVYHTVQARDNADSLMAGLAEGRIDLVTFTSSSTVRNFKALLPADAPELMQGVKIASIGPITSDTAQKEGFDVHVSAKTYTIPGLCEAIVRYFQEKE